MTRLLVCLDGSAYADNICGYAAWAAKRLNAEITLLHVLRRHSDYQAPADHTGAIGLSARSELLEELTKIDEERGRLDQRKGKFILEHGAKALMQAGVASVKQAYRRGSLVETIQELEADADMIFIGKRGEQADLGSKFLGSNLEKVARTIHKPLFVVPSANRPIKSFLIAYDGKESAQKAVEHIASRPLLKGLDCHLLAVESVAGEIDSSGAEQKLRSAGFSVTVTTEQSAHPDEAIASYVAKRQIDLLATGAYSHSVIRSLLLGSTTANLIKACDVPLLLFR